MKIDKENQYFIDKFLLGCHSRWTKKMEYEPLKIVFNLMAPIALTHPWMNFDGLICHLMLIDALRDDYFVLPRKFPISRLLSDIKLPPLPIKETNELYHSSISIFDTDRKALEILYKKFEDRWAGGKKKIQRASGYFRDYMIHHIYIPTKTVTFYVSGDYNELNRLCKLIIGLGDNTRIGWGAVRDYKIEKTEKDISIIKDNIAMRPIPEHLLKSASEKAVIAWKPPYWDPKTATLCALPGAEVELK